MPHPEIDNRTAFAFEPVFVADEDARPVCVPVVKATWSIGADGELVLAEEQRPVDLAGSCRGEPGASSLITEPETAFVKLATDVVLVGHAHAPHVGATEVGVSLRVGPVIQNARVTGDRHWVRRLIGTSISDPLPFERIPLCWERAFGGWDRSAEDPRRHDCEPRNPVGVGYRARRGEFVEASPLPNVEDTKDGLARYRGRCRPVGFGFVSPDWKPRSDLVGTYDDAWERSRSPLLPLDFDRRFFNSAPPELVAPGFLRGDEAVTVVGASPEGRTDFALPGIDPPRCRLRLRSRPDVDLVTALDTVVVDLDERELVLIWRAQAAICEEPLDVEAIRVTSTNAPTAAEHENPSNVVPLFAAATG